MPSIYNNENSCWGVKRTYFRPNLGLDLFQNECTADENQSALNLKISDTRCTTNSIGTLTRTAEDESPSENQIKPVCFSVSSNGYYGYQPHNQLLPFTQAIDTNKDSEMEIDGDDLTMHHSGPNNLTRPSNYTQIQNTEQTNVLFRKRHIHENETFSGIKKLKQADPEAHLEISAPSTSQQINSGGGGFGGDTCRRKPEVITNEDSETIEVLKHTHGCELYLYHRTCDY